MNAPNHNSPDEPKAPLLVRFPWIRVSFFLLVCGFIAIGLVLSSSESFINKVLEQIPDESETADVVTTVIVPPKEDAVVEPVIVEPVEHTAKSGGDLRKMSKGFTLETKVTLGEGELASVERLSEESYVARYELMVNLPKPSKGLDSLEMVNPHLGEILPDLGNMLATATVSPYFYELYKRKADRLESKSTQLDSLLTRHNLYDCETILNLKHPKTERKALLVQAEMDVVSDGSDGDRLPTMPDEIVNSSYYQPMTSYGWKKTGTVPNPLIAGWKNRIKKAKAEIALSSTKKDRKSWLKARIKKIEREIDDLQRRSYLIADYDPFIVMPVGMVTTSGNSHYARVGDYAVVIYKDKVYPAIVGDAGPSYKVGEASLRMCKELNPRANSYNRPVSDLAVTYIVFPRTADTFQAPDYDKWHQKCEELLKEIGGLGNSVTLHQWENTFPKVVEPIESGSLEIGKGIIPQ